MNANFPILPGDAFAVCMNCHKSLQEVAPTDDGYPTGRGRYRKTCPACGMSTWYDVADNFPASCRTVNCGRAVVPGMSVCSIHWRETVGVALANSLKDAHRRR